MRASKRPPHEQLAWRNRRLLAERLHWPDGALEACETIERANRDWFVFWIGANACPGFNRPAGYTAIQRGSTARPVQVFEGTPQALAEALELTAAKSD